MVIAGVEDASRIALTPIDAYGADELSQLLEDGVSFSRTLPELSPLSSEIEPEGLRG
eukprot:CAMPEP_0184296494 /NCGR_PEP_ID=MMETSP1049-20130417/7469_1 /TAXON_ID=77928 /ORGANISM="Proteomonas sulcata, Strain CCMP704" /LENGTH=56 /DNA_ID=CAMNT_0026605759 /DNA_START=265 /DNA_END=435 /DNA_ORIENTATION=-